MMEQEIPPAWAGVLEPAFATGPARRLFGWLRAEEEEGKRIYPPRGQRLRALALTAPEAVKAVILGQDPYHGPGQAHGLSFSVPDGVALPPSLRNIFRELAADCAIPPSRSGNLERWAQRGVLLLNATLTVEHGRPGSHAGRGWEPITDAVVAAVAGGAEPVAFLAWGNHARAKLARLAGLAGLAGLERHLLLASPHPSPLSAYRGFLGSRPFSQANAFLEEHGRQPIRWSLAGEALPPAPARS